MDSDKVWDVEGRKMEKEGRKMEKVKRLSDWGTE